MRPCLLDAVGEKLEGSDVGEVGRIEPARGTRDPSIAISATAKAVSVDIGTPHPCDCDMSGWMTKP